MPEIYLGQPGFTYNACGAFAKNKERSNTKTWDLRYIYQNELDKAYFQYDMAYWDFKNLPRGIDSEKVLHDQAFNIAKNLKCIEYQRNLVSMVYKFLINVCFQLCC